MKKLFLIGIVIILILVCCSCNSENTFVEGSLLYDLGAKSFENIEKVGFWHEEYQGDYEEKIEITKNEDIEILCNYNYSSDYPSDELHKLFVFPTNSLYVTIDEVEYQLVLSENSELTTVPNNNFNKARTYKAEKGKGFTNDVWQRLIQNYQ